MHIISGAAGCNEQEGICVNAILGPKGPWSAFRSWLPGTNMFHLFSPVCSRQLNHLLGLYGYGRLRIDNATHLHWEQVYDFTEWVEDSIDIVQHQHAPFPHKP